MRSDTERADRARLADATVTFSRVECAPVQALVCSTRARKSVVLRSRTDLDRNVPVRLDLTVLNVLKRVPFNERRWIWTDCPG